MGSREAGSAARKRTPKTLGEPTWYHVTLDARKHKREPQGRTVANGGPRCCRSCVCCCDCCCRRGSRAVCLPSRIIPCAAHAKVSAPICSCDRGQNATHNYSNDKTSSNSCHYWTLVNRWEAVNRSRQAVGKRLDKGTWPGHVKVSCCRGTLRLLRFHNSMRDTHFTSVMCACSLTLQGFNNSDDRTHVIEQCQGFLVFEESCRYCWGAMRQIVQ